ncbi:hypothetical protein BDB01DRAFT_718536 [Pilobolus umbonatus]|nr:hypothetical protein BDB01DRAFT_718536 [Pilobolus umbonatus]
MNSQIAGYTVSNTASSNVDINEAINDSKRVSSFLLHMLYMIEPQQIKSNEIVKDAYEECMKLKECLSDHLWSQVDNDTINSIQSSIDDLTQALSKYEMTSDMVEGEW